jgi:NADPH:quinone reductase-like Zn-dependent oxidoreductase
MSSKTMRAVRLHAPGGVDALAFDEVATPRPAPGEALVRVHAAGITRNELEWPTDRLPATPSYELSGVVEGVANDVDAVEAGAEVYALTSFDRDGAAAEYVALPAALLAGKPASLDHVESAALPLAGLSAWQGLLDHGRLERGSRVLIHGAAGGVGHLATQLARARGAYVVGTASAASAERARTFGAHEVFAYDDDLTALEPFDLVFDTAGGDLLSRSVALIRRGGRLVSIAEDPPDGVEVETIYFVVEPDRAALEEIAQLADEGSLRPEIDSVFALADARRAFERVAETGKHGKVVLRVDE